jgi:glycosyltransferase involved in cell wall biosynthesis
MQTIFIHHRSAHHAKNSGYSCLLDYFPDATSITGVSKLPYVFAKNSGRFSSQDAGLYDSSSVFKDFELFKETRKKNKNNIIHYLNGERDVRYNVKYNRSNNIYCASFHKPPQILEERIKNTNYLKKLSGAICVGKNQVDFIKNWLDLKNVHYIPHGVDTQFFCPSKDINNDLSIKLLFVGQHLRDFELFNEIVPILYEKLKKIKVDVILKKQFAKFVKPHKCIQIHSNLNDQTLRSFYHNADALLLPLKDATACNAILEALSCGLPIITSDVGGVKEYLAGSDNLALKSKEEFIEESISLMNDKEKLKLLSEQSRKIALELDWNIIAKKINDFHETTIDLQY